MEGKPHEDGCLDNNEMMAFWRTLRTSPMADWLGCSAGRLSTRRGEAPRGSHAQVGQPRGLDPVPGPATGAAGEK